MPSSQGFGLQLTFTLGFKGLQREYEDISGMMTMVSIAACRPESASPLLPWLGDLFQAWHTKTLGQGRVVCIRTELP